MRLKADSLSFVGFFFILSFASVFFSLNDSILSLALYTIVAYYVVLFFKKKEEIQHMCVDSLLFSDEEFVSLKGFFNEKTVTFVSSYSFTGDS